MADDTQTAPTNYRGEPLITSRFDTTTTAEEVIADKDLSSRNAIVTGGGSGIGREIARGLAMGGAEVVIADVDIDTATATAGAINSELGRDTVTARKVDLAAFASIDTFADDYLGSGTKLDILINNAGVMAPPLRRTAEGHELQLGINHLGHYRLTQGLLPALRSGDGARVVCVSSIGHRRSDIIYDDPDYLTRPYDRWEAYGQSKTACALITIALGERLSGDGVFVNTMNPGGSMTGLQRFLTEEEQRELGWIDENGKVLARWRTPAQCAATSVWIATADETRGVSGRYFEDCNESATWTPERPMNGTLPHLNRENAERLHALTERLVAG
ncbi:SDR family NAD(P)-dependent oxidoreductase [Oricola sp.]|uniref:SDR family NAD(P)-dependent oxidoreductase n=1 Tax=Oricola sp. TaxID=1979950 RepID=UPI0025E52E53|nr:SDR family NAD(P)-dependent oxidoreductase [Oricola sp.]MCI5074201.1 SDR family NAD(P)-dependent oxidoreductase [Oricola sp.]